MVEARFGFDLVCCLFHEVQSGSFEVAARRTRQNLDSGSGTVFLDPKTHVAIAHYLV